MTGLRVGPVAPPYGTPEYKWWAAGATAEAEIRKEGRNPAGLEVAEFVDGCAQDSRRSDWTAPEFAEVAARIYCPGLPWRQRWSLAWSLIRGYPRTKKRPGSEARRWWNPKR